MKEVITKGLIIKETAIGVQTKRMADILVEFDEMTDTFTVISHRVNKVPYTITLDELNLILHSKNRVLVTGPEVDSHLNLRFMKAKNWI